MGSKKNKQKNTCIRNFSPLRTTHRSGNRSGSAKSGRARTRSKLGRARAARARSAFGALLPTCRTPTGSSRAQRRWVTCLSALSLRPTAAQIGDRQVGDARLRRLGLAEKVDGLLLIRFLPSRSEPSAKPRSHCEYIVQERRCSFQTPWQNYLRTSKYVCFIHDCRQFLYDVYI